MKNIIKRQKNSTVSWLCALAIGLAIKVEKSHCCGEVLNSAADAILTHSARSIRKKLFKFVCILCFFWWLTDRRALNSHDLIVRVTIWMSFSQSHGETVG